MESVGSISPADILTMVNTNFVGLVALTQEILRSYLARGGHGDIVNVGSIAGREGYVGGSIYCATKAALRTFTEALRKEMVNTRVRVMQLDPGLVETEFFFVRFRGDVEKANQFIAYASLSFLYLFLLPPPPGLDEMINICVAYI